MKALPDEVVGFFQKQGFILVSTQDEKGFPHASCKGLVEIDAKGRVYLLDLYQGRTLHNLSRRPQIALSAVDERGFQGFCLKGRAEITGKEKLSSRIIKAWEKRITHRITQRLLRNIKGEKGRRAHPESVLPGPQYMIVVDVEDIVDLRPPGV